MQSLLLRVSAGTRHDRDSGLASLKPELELDTDVFRESSWLPMVSFTLRDRACLSLGSEGRGHEMIAFPSSS